MADVGCSHGGATLLMADAFAKSEFVGFDEHARLIEEARRQAAADVAGGRVSFEVAKAKEYPGEGTTWWPTKPGSTDPAGRRVRVRPSGRMIGR